jgi:hypothetical protein
MRLSSRVVLIALLSLGVVASGVHYADNHDQQWPYPTGDDIAADYTEHLGEKTLLFGTVRTVNSETATVVVSHSDGSVKLTVEDFEASVRPGGTVQVFGTLQPDQRVVAETLVVVNPAESSKSYKYALSAVGAGVVLLSFFREWQVNTETLRFEVR